MTSTLKRQAQPTEGFGPRLKNTRELRGFSIADVAREISCSRTQVRQLESRSHAGGISVPKVIELARLYRVPVGYLLVGEVQTGLVIVSDAVDNPVAVLEQVTRDLPKRRKLAR